MTSDPLADARTALANGKHGQAVRLAWNDVRTAVLAQDVDTITAGRHLAEEIAAASDGRARTEAEQLAAYCTGCLLEPQEPVGSLWALGRLTAWGRRRRRPCPDCAELIAVDARVCRYCGHRLAPPPTSID